MMKFKTNIEELDTKEIVNSEYIDWNYYRNTTILVTGATGLIGYQIILALLFANETLNTNIKIFALARNAQKVSEKFKDNLSNNLNFVIQDITEEIKCPNVDYIIHTANGTASKGFVENPVETITSIVIGTKNVLEFGKNHKVKGIVYLSSMEVYGNIPLDRKEPLKEDDYGYIDVLKVRNSYPLGKRIAENMCISYHSEYSLPVKIARLSQTIGAGVDYLDNRVFAQFARNIVEQDDIVLHTQGETVRSYCYITDCVSAILTMLQKGRNGESYNIANTETTCSIYSMAKMLVDKYPTSKLRIELDEKFYPQATKYYLDTTKYYLDTTWKAKVNLEEMFERLISNFKDKGGILWRN